jgi:DNA polymerase (family 10)
MKSTEEDGRPAPAGLTLSNAEIADQLMSLAQLLTVQRENAFKVRAYRRAAKSIRMMSQSLGELVRDDADLTEYAGIGGELLACPTTRLVASSSLL